jgi:DNA-binding NtrC family response regulator
VESRARILVIDDEPVVQDVLGRLLARAGYERIAAAGAVEGKALVEREQPDVVILDVMLPDGSGLDLLKEIKVMDPERPVIMMTAYGSVNDAVEAMKQGAFHYVTKPFSNEEVLLQVQKALDNRRLREENRVLRSLLASEGSYEGIVGKSEAIRAVFRTIEQVAASRSTVLIVGESGTGKELVARAIHHRSSRAGKPFVAVHSGGIPADLMESNLFGHVRGAFTGATSGHEGLLRAADGGTLFLDEIGTLRLELQAKLLRAMQERSFMPVGSTEMVSVDIRILAATNVDLKLLVENGTFREDLYYRLNVVTIRIPPLRERHEDIGLLASHFLRLHAAENGKPLVGLEPEAMEALMRHPWPGNVRELENAIIQGVVLSSGTRLGLSDLPPEVRGDAPGHPVEALSLAEGVTLAEAMEAYERKMIQEALRDARGVQRQAARRLGIRPTTLNEKIKRLGMRSDPAPS